MAVKNLTGVTRVAELSLSWAKEDCEKLRPAGSELDESGEMLRGCSVHFLQLYISPNMVT